MSESMILSYKLYDLMPLITVYFLVLPSFVYIALWNCARPAAPPTFWEAAQLHNLMSTKTSPRPYGPPCSTKYLLLLFAREALIPVKEFLPYYNKRRKLQTIDRLETSRILQVRKQQHYLKLIEMKPNNVTTFWGPHGINTYHSPTIEGNNCFEEK